MTLFFVSVILSLLIVFIGFFNGGMSDIQTHSRPTEVNVGALFTFNSTIGRVTKPAIEAAVEDVNADSSILAGTRLNLIMQDTNCDEFLGVIEGLQLMEKDVVAILGPQSSGIAHTVSHVVNELRVPLLSFAATDPTLSSQQNSYFFCTTQSDYFQMNAVAALIEYYGWREVIAIFVDNDYGRGGITTLDDALAARRSKISYKAALQPNADRNTINDLLVRLNLMSSRVFVVHVNPDSGLSVFSVAKHLGMMGSGYVWIATDWLPSVLDSSEQNGREKMDLIQGVIAFRNHIPESNPKKMFDSRWNGLLRNGTASSGLNSYAYYAYDSVWMIARSLDRFLNKELTISFTSNPRLADAKGSALHLETLRTFSGGAFLLQELLSTNFVGVTGQVQFTSDRNLINPAYEIINILGTGSRRIGFWSNSSGFSLVSPEALSEKSPNTSTNNHKLYDVIWPGETAVKPRGWVFPNSGVSLKVGVPNRASFKQFVSKDHSPDMVSGYCIDIFKAAISLLPYPVPYSFILFGNGSENPSYNQLVDMVYQNKFDAAVGDVSIVTNRMKVVDFTQPYVDSGLVVVTPIKKRESNAWAFLRPFTVKMWLVTGASFLVVGTVIWILEHRINEEFRGSPREQIVTIFWFSFSTMFFSQRENTVSTLGRFVLIIWFFVVLIINSSYTASLTSILTVQEVSPLVEGLESLIAGSDPIGYQVGSFAKSYMVEDLHIAESRLKELGGPEQYLKALDLGPKNGGVSAIIDELPYVELFLSSKCNFKVVGQSFTKSGWGFAFPRDSPLAIDMSTAILALSENGDLQRIHDKWLTKTGCSPQTDSITSNKQSLQSFWGLFLICGLSCVTALLIFFTRVLCQYSRYNTSDDPESVQPQMYSRGSSRGKSIKNLMIFVDKKEEEVESAIKRKFSDKQQSTSYISSENLTSPT